MPKININKILILSMPRCGTTIIQQLVSQKLFGVHNFIEPFNVSKPANIRNNIDPFVDPYTWTKKLNQGVFKLLAINLHTLKIEPFLYNDVIDHCVIIDRINLTDCCLSLYYAEMNKQYHYKKNEEVPMRQFECSQEYIDNWLKVYHMFCQARNLAIDSDVACDFLNYEKFMQNEIQYIAGKPLQLSQIADIDTTLAETKLNYKELCKNYSTIEQYLQHRIEC